MKSIILGFLVFASVGSQAAVVCFNKPLTSTAPLKIELTVRRATASYLNSICRLKKIPYSPKSPKYQGWIRLGSPKDNCADLGLALFGESSTSKKPIRVYWISVSTEVQTGNKGLIQIGYENDVNPGRGPESKLLMDCYPN